MRRETFIRLDVFDNDLLAQAERAAPDGGFIMTIPKVLEEIRFESSLRHNFQRPGDMIIELNAAEMGVLYCDGSGQYLLQEGLEFCFPQTAH